ncbi:MAG: archaellin/type IV pilin N-terminal domain-containing protein [Halovenus sp.]
MTSDDDRGQVGIGTLIIFIALVLVAAVAAGVLVNTAGLLQGQAEETGQDAQSEVGNQIDVVSANGAVSGDTVDTATVVVKKSPGSDPLDLEEATIQYSSGNASETLLYSNSSADDSNFTTAGITGDATVLTDTGDRIEIEIDVDAVEGGLAEGDSATLRIVDQSGATTTYVLNPPSTFGERSNVDL